MSSFPNDHRPSSEAAGLLISIVRALSSSSDGEQREEEKIRLERAFKESDRKLDNMVTDHLNDLTSIIAAFSKMSSKVTTSQEKIRSVKENLQSCKNLLHCKRDELRRLWIEGIKYKTVYAMMDEVEKMKNVGDQLRKYMESKHYLTCTTLLMSSLSMLDGDLCDVDGLKEIRNDLIAKKDELYEVLTEELNKVIYLRSTSSIVKHFQRQGSQRQSKNKAYMKLAIKIVDDEVSREDEALRGLMSADVKSISSSTEPIVEDLNANPDVDLVKFISVLVESLALLRRMPDTIDHIRSRVGPGLVTIVRRASQQVADSAYVEGEELSQLQQPQFLLEMLELVFKQFHIVAKVHEILLANMKKTKNAMSSLGDFNIYDIMEIWGKMQSVLQSLLTHYLDTDEASTARAANNGSSAGDVVDISLYFAKKKPTKSKKGSLFKFNRSSHAISMDSYMREQRQEYYGSDETSPYSGRTIFICKASPDNIIAIYNSLTKFLIDAEKATKVAPGLLSLQKFLKEFVEGVYLPRVQHDADSVISQAAKGHDLKKKLTDQHTQRALNIPKPVLQSTIMVAGLLQDTCHLMRDMPDYSSKFMNIICKTLQDYLLVCQTAYRECINTEADDRKVISAMWVKDDDINRFLRTLPSWISLKKASEEEDMVSEKDLRAMNAKESLVLTNNLLTGSESGVPYNEIISDAGQLRTLGNLCESMEWFSARIKDFANGLEAGVGARFISTGADQSVTSGNSSGGSAASIAYNVQRDTIVTLRSLSHHYEDLSELCLLLLHLEARVHCLHHLLRIPKSDYCGAIDKLEPDENVTRLNKDLMSLEEIIAQSLQPLKFRYVFEGLSHLISTILVGSAQMLKRINENGVKKMCRNVHTVQQCLSNITGNREPDLDHARQFYELLYLSPDDVMKACFERGKQFSEQEYTLLLQLNHRSTPTSTEADLQMRLKKLASILLDLSL